MIKFILLIVETSCGKKIRKKKNLNLKKKKKKQTKKFKIKKKICKIENFIFFLPKIHL